MVYLTWRWPIIVKALRKVYSYHFIFHTITLLHTHTQREREGQRIDIFLLELTRDTIGMFLCVCVLVEYIEKKWSFLICDFIQNWFLLLIICVSNQRINWHFLFLRFCLFDALFLHYHCSLLFLDTLIYHTFPSLHDNPFGWDSNWSGCLHCHCWYPCIICTIIGRSSSQGGQLCFSR